jgi:hypothetical protein
MAKVTRARIEASLTVTLELSEKEVKALDGIFGYDVEQFLKVFYERMGKAYVQPHEEGVRALHATIRQQLAGPIREYEKARKALHESVQPPKPCSSPSSASSAG